MRSTLWLALALTCLHSPVRAHDPPTRHIATLTARIAERPHDVELLLERARAWTDNNRFTEALSDLRVVHALGVRHLDVALMRARVLEAIGHEAAAEAVLDVELTRAPSYQAFIGRARLREGANRYAESLADFERAYDLRVTVEVAFGRIAVLRRLRMHDEAVLVGQEALDILGDAVVLRLALVDALVDARRFDEASREVQRGRAHARATERWDLRQAHVLAVSGRLDEARRLRSSALVRIRSQRLGRPTAARWLLEAEALHALGRHEQARRALERALQLGPRYQRALRFAAELSGTGR